MAPLAPGCPQASLASQFPGVLVPQPPPPHCLVRDMGSTRPVLHARRLAAGKQRAGGLPDRDQLLGDQRRSPLGSLIKLISQPALGCDLHSPPSLPRASRGWGTDKGTPCFASSRSWKSASVGRALLSSPAHSAPRDGLDLPSSAQQSVCHLPRG